MTYGTISKQIVFGDRNRVRVHLSFRVRFRVGVAVQSGVLASLCGASYCGYHAVPCELFLQLESSLSCGVGHLCGARECFQRPDGIMGCDTDTAKHVTYITIIIWPSSYRDSDLFTDRNGLDASLRTVDPWGVIFSYITGFGRYALYCCPFVVHVPAFLYYYSNEHVKERKVKELKDIGVR